MSTTVKTGWLNNKSGEFFAPKTLISQVQTSDGVLLEDKIQQDLNVFKNRVVDDIKTDINISQYETKEDAADAHADINTLLSHKIPFDNTDAISLNSGDDLNNFKIPGIYISGASGVSSTLVNAPTTGSGFKLFVIDGYISGRVSQFVTTNNNNLHYRQFNGTSWGDWTTLATKAGLDNKETKGTAATLINRTTAVNVADTNYTTYIARGIAAGTDDLTAGVSSLASGCLYFVYE